MCCKTVLSILRLQNDCSQCDVGAIMHKRRKNSKHFPNQDLLLQDQKRSGQEIFFLSVLSEVHTLAHNPKGVCFSLKITPIVCNVMILKITKSAAWQFFKEPECSKVFGLELE